MALSITATYTHGTQKFWVYEHMSDEGIFKFWIPHTKRVQGTSKFLSQRPPTTMDIHVEFERDETNKKESE
ncbi:MAG TPA: hypothetical protein VL866_24430 [Pyrinomonadaceae bacterium]|nr:hypothetical protein [Pyrinomonadaceae bacterium]